MPDPDAHLRRAAQVLHDTTDADIRTRWAELADMLLDHRLDHQEAS